MGQIAYAASTGEIIEAFSDDDDSWAALCAAPKGAILMPRTNWPAVAKTSIRGLRFFAHHSGYPGTLPAPESYNHTRLKIDIAMALRSLGFNANVEVPGAAPDGAEWVADVLAEAHDGSKVAFEIQFSSQHRDQFRKRSERYVKSDIRVCWFMPEKPVALRITKALAYQNLAYYKQHKEFLVDCEEIVPFTLGIEGKTNYPDPLPPVRFGRGRYRNQLTLNEAVAGMMIGMPRWELPDWNWVDP
jgi:hypothetical protein